MCTPHEIEITINKFIHEVIEDSGIKFEVLNKGNQCHVQDDFWILNLDSKSAGIK